MSSSVNRTNNKQLIERIISRCSKLTGLELNIATFPGPQPVAIEKRHFDILNKNEYVVCEKTDGERKILIILYINEKPMCFIVDRNKDYHFIELSFKKELFEGCIFDCELITGTKPSLVIHDCFAYNGVNFTDKPHSMRYYSVLDFIGKRYQYKESDPFKIKTKTFYHKQIVKKAGVKKVGEKLLLAMFEESKRRGYEKIICRIVQRPFFNQASISFHEKFGFKKIGEMSEYEIDLGIYLKISEVCAFEAK
jgi:hypothetical protein